MKKRISIILVVAMLFTLLVPLTVTTVSADTPTLITDQESFVSAIATNSVKDSDGKATGSFKLANDITISGEWNFTTAFRGELDGNGHTITFADGATVKGGLFQAVGANAYIHDLQIAQAGSVTWVLQTAPGCENACLGGVVGLSGAGAVNGVNSWGKESYVSNSANKVRIENVTVDVNMDVTGSAVNASVGGIVGEIGLYTEITNCTFNGYISDATNRYNSGNKDTYCKDMVGATVRSAYGGMVGVGFRRAVMVISDCTNNGNITGYGQEGGILGTVNNAWDDLIKTVTIQRCINTGAITCRGTETKSNVGGIAGFVFLKDDATATVQNCINEGSISASGNARASGIVGNLRRGANNAFQLIGNLQECTSFTGSQIAQTLEGSGTVVFTNNYGCGAGSANYSPLSDASAYEAAYATLDAAYPGVYKWDSNYSKVTLSWAHVHTFGAWIIDQAGSCVKAEIKHRVCSTCDYVEEVVTPAPGHTFVSGTCTVCGASEVAGGIYTQSDLAAMEADGDYTLENDIVISGNWSYATAFTGSLNGKGHTITFADGATVNGGLFKTLNQGATIENLNIEAGDGVTWKVVSDAAGSGSPCLGGVAASAEAGNVGGTNMWGDTAFVSNPDNTVTIQNVTVTANIAISGATGGDDKVACGGIIGDLGIISLIKNCTFNGSISDQNRTKADSGRMESGYAGIVGVTIRNGGPVQIVECVNNGSITGYGQEGGILGYSRAWGSGGTGLGSLIIEKCINNGAINCQGTASSASVGGIAGYVYLKDTSTASILNCINAGAIEKSGSAYAGGMVGCLRRGADDAFEFIGCLQDNAELSSISQITTAQDGSGSIKCVNNYSTSGNTNSTLYTKTSDATEYAAAFTTLNAAYPNVYRMFNDHITLKYAVAEGAHEHSWGDWIIDQAAGCTTTGSKHHECSGCDEIQVEVIPATGHNFVDGVCTECGKIEGYIYDQADLAAMEADGDYTLQNDITISGTWNYSTVFTGTLDGNNHTITFADGVTIIGGLFQQLSSKAFVKNLNIVQAGSATYTPIAPDGSGAWCVGALVASIEYPADSNDTAITANAENTIQILNVNVTANITSITTKDNKKGYAVGGIAGEIGMITSIWDCTFNGSISDQNRSYVTMNAYESGYAGIVGVAIRNGGPLRIVNCTNNGDITGYGQEAGILGYSRAWGGGATGLGKLIIEDCVNNGTITCLQTALGTEGDNKRATAGGIAGYVYAGAEKTAIIQNNVNYGNVTSAGGELAMSAGIVARIHKGLVVIFGNVNNGSVSTAEGGQTDDIVVKVDGSSGFIVNENDGTTQAGSIATIKGFQMTDIEDSKRSIRFVAGISDDLGAADKVGIEIRVYDGTKEGDVFNYKTAEGVTTGVNTSIYADGELVTATELGANYLYTAIINNVPTELGTVRLLVRTYHIVGNDTYYGNYSFATLDLTD